MLVESHRDEVQRLFKAGLAILLQQALGSSYRCMHAVRRYFTAAAPELTLQVGQATAAMGLTEQKIVMDMLAWAGNVSSSVLIIFVNKILMNRTGYGFKYGECPQKEYNPMATAVP